VEFNLTLERILNLSEKQKSRRKSRMVVGQQAGGGHVESRDAGNLTITGLPGTLSFRERLSKIELCQHYLINLRLKDIDLTER
jgi:hypothetical protein